MSEDQFTKLFKYIENFRKDVDQRFEQVDARFDQMQSAMDGCVKEIMDLREETAMMGHKLSRHDRYFEVIAQKVGVNLN